MIAALRLALRRLLRQPGPALSALLTLGLAMGASIALYSVLQTVLLRPLPLTQPDQVYHVFREQPPVQAGPISPAGWAELEAASDEGSRQLERQQSKRVRAYQKMWSCLMCDAARSAAAP